MGLSTLSGTYADQATNFGTLVVTVSDEGAVQGTWSGFSIPGTSPVVGSFELNQGQAEFSQGDQGSTGANYLTAATNGTLPFSSNDGSNCFFLLSLSGFVEIGRTDGTISSIVTLTNDLAGNGNQVSPTRVNWKKTA